MYTSRTSRYSREQRVGMSRYIDADKLKKHYSWWQGGTLAKTLDEMKRDFDTIVDLQPTIEAEPIKHGRWIKVDKHTVKCSECSNYLDMRGVNAGRGDAGYCPNCGADMRERREDDCY